MKASPKKLYAKKKTSKYSGSGLATALLKNEEVFKQMLKAEKNEIKSTAHSRYRCQYHIAFAPKYRRKKFMAS